MSGGLIIASNTVLAEVYNGLQEAIRTASKANTSASGQMGAELASLTDELRKYKRDISKMQPQSSMTELDPVLTEAESCLLDAFRLAAQYNSNGCKSFMLADLAREIRKCEKALNPPKKTGTTPSA